YGRAVREGTTMKAVRLHKECGPEQLVYEDAPKPELGAGDAASEFTPRALRLPNGAGRRPTEIATGLTACPRYRDTRCPASLRAWRMPGDEFGGGHFQEKDGHRAVQELHNTGSGR